MSKDFYSKKICRLCSSKNLTTFLKLEPTPPGNHFIKRSKNKKIQKKYPLELNFCKDCYHVQLKHVVRSDILFQRDYSYLSGTSTVFVDHLERFANKIIKKFSLKKNDIIVEIGSNDGTALSFFKKNKLKCIGVDPAKKPVEIAKKKNIESICDFFSYKVADSIKKNYGSAKIITSHNTLAHIDNWDEIARSVYKLLDKDGVFIFEVGYFVDVFNNNLFDTIYHEHLDYHTLYPLSLFMKKHNMIIFHTERIHSQGGSIRVYVKKSESKIKVQKTVQNLIRLEKKNKMFNLKNLRTFEEKLLVKKAKIKKLLSDIQKSNKVIIGYGAPTKATTLMYYFGIKKYIKFLVEDNKLKQNMLSPGLHLEVVSSDKIFKIKPDYIFIFAWNFSNSIMKKNKKFINNGGIFIQPLPNLKIIKKL